MAAGGMVTVSMYRTMLLHESQIQGFVRNIPEGFLPLTVDSEIGELIYLIHRQRLSAGGVLPHIFGFILFAGGWRSDFQGSDNETKTHKLLAIIGDPIENQ